MPKLIQCESCDVNLLAFESRGPKPIRSDECPQCGESEFSFVE